MKKNIYLLAAGLTLSGISAFTTPAVDQGAEGSRIELLKLYQPPCTALTAQSVIKAKLAYRIADTVQAEYGFAVSIKFQSTRQGMTFSDGRVGEVTVKAKRDTLILSYPMAAIRHNALLKRPITCYFYLHRNTAPGRSTVIAKTGPVVFQECQ
ncbi:hypothetical protein [Hymenobacter wooponensis]|uniref:VirK protein n=1 Tax=Hymenobacter wooponensis TaxID=1525360 RepID=A0A4Z0MK83_9BACT|nr:hypothetical protein [Hymenobacter wooponensis]TGD80252.1 hypothetical protein EU557_10420 [Hymenobacter wooponensis]